MAAEELHAAQVDAAGVGGLHGLVSQLVGPDTDRPAVPAQRLSKADRVVLPPRIGGDERPPGREHFVVQVDRTPVGVFRRLDVPDPAFEVDVQGDRTLQLAGPFASRGEDEKPRAGFAVTEFAGALLVGELRGNGGDDAVRHALRPSLRHLRPCDAVDNGALVGRAHQLEDLREHVQPVPDRFRAEAGERPFRGRALNRIAGDRLRPLATEPRHPRLEVRPFGGVGRPSCAESQVAYDQPREAPGAARRPHGWRRRHFDLLLPPLRQRRDGRIGGKVFFPVAPAVLPNDGEAVRRLVDADADACAFHLLPFI